MSIKTAALTVVAILAALPAVAQDGDGQQQQDQQRRRGQRRPGQPGDDQAQRQQDPERQAQQRARWLKEQLGLTDEQVQKAVEIYKQITEAEQKLEKERQSKLREMMTDEQKKKYDEILEQRARGGGQGGGPGGGGFLGGFDRMMEGWSDTLKKELTLEDAAFDKVKTLIDEFRKKIQERTEKLRQDGFQGLNWQEEMQKFQEGTKELGEKIKEHLSAEQKEKFDKLLERLVPGGRGFGGDRRGGPTPEERAARVMEAMKIADASEASLVKAAVAKVFEAQHALGEHDREMRGKLEEIQKDGSLSDEQVNAKLNELKTARQDKDKAWRAAQSALREIVSARQELELIRQAVLR